MHPISKLALAVMVVGSVASCTVSTVGRGTAVDLVATVGDCIDHPQADSDVAAIDCAAPEAVYEVAVTLPGTDARCPSEDYARYWRTVGDKYTLCLMLNAAEGDCFDGLLINEEDLDEAEATGPVRADCASAGTVVSKVVTGVAVEKDGEVGGVCTADTEVPKVYPEPPPGRTVCLSVP